LDAMAEMDICGVKDIATFPTNKENYAGEPCI